MDAKLQKPTLDLADPDVFERVYAEHRPRAFAAALGVTRDPEAAEDVVQDVFAQLWLRPSFFDPDRGSLRSYVTMLARSRALDRWRSQSARDAALERLAVDSGRTVVEEKSAADVAIARESSSRVMGRVRRLPDAQREAVLLAFGKQLTASEVAAAVGVPVGTAKSRVRLGLQRLRAADASVG
jgi:RNA polymerase sigma-70 factor (ECF subfamily)